MAADNGARAHPLRLSVIVTNWNTRDYLAACLESMQGLLDAPDCEIIVVDNGSVDGSVAMVIERFPSVRVLCLAGPAGFSRANNVGLREARGLYAVLLNSDTEVRDDAMRRLCAFMDAHPRCGVVGPQLLNGDGTVQYSCRRFPSHLTAFFHRYSLLTRLFPRNRFSQDYLMTGSGHRDTMEADWVSGACLMARSEAVAQVGLLDEGFFMYAEDVDWCYRMKLAGWKVMYHPDAKVTHHIGGTTRQAPCWMIRERHRSMWRFYRKHYSRGIVLVDVATWLGIRLRCLLQTCRALARKAAGRRTRA